MLKLTKKLEYALISIRHMQLNNNKISSAKEIADRYMIPYEILAKTLQHMCRLKYIISIYGPKGGYQLNSSLNSITLTQFVEDIEGPFGLVDCNINLDCLQTNNCNIKEPINQINNNIRAILSNIKINDIMQHN